MKRTLLSIASVLFITLMGVSCCDCDCGDKNNNGENSNATTETVGETKSQDANENVEVSQPKQPVKDLTITKSDIAKVNNFIGAGNCDEAVAEINSWKGKKPADGIKLLRDINISGQCAKEVGDAINGLGK